MAAWPRNAKKRDARRLKGCGHLFCSAKYCYFLLRRWWRVLRSNLRCFFLAIRLRRFLITEPTKVPYRLDVVPAVGKRPRAKQQTVQLTGSYSDVKRSLTGYRLSGAHLDRAAALLRARGRRPSAKLDQPVSVWPSTTAPLRYCSTAFSGTR
jgi:hypothetical protein